MLYLLDKYNYSEKAYRGEVWFRIGLHKYYTEFLTSIGNENIPIVFLQSWGQKIPQDKKMQEQVLIAIYGELQRILGMWEVEHYFREERRKKREEEWKKKQEEERKTIKVGEQVTFEKWLANEK